MRRHFECLSLVYSRAPPPDRILVEIGAVDFLVVLVANDDPLIGRDEVRLVLHRPFGDFIRHVPRVDDVGAFMRAAIGNNDMILKIESIFRHVVTSAAPAEGSASHAILHVVDDTGGHAALARAPRGFGIGLDKRDAELIAIHPAFLAAPVGQARR